MGNIFVTDMTHFEGIPPGPAYGPARKIAQFFGDIASAASVHPVGEWIDAALFCRKRPAMARCPGHIQIRRDGVPGVISWRCTRCSDQGEIRNWEGTSRNLSKWKMKRLPAQDIHELILAEDELVELRQSPLLSPECRSLVYEAVIAHGGTVLRATLKQLEELQENIAADANHESRRRRQRLLDSAYERIETLFDEQHYCGSGFDEMPDESPKLSPEIEHFLDGLDDKIGRDSKSQPPDAKAIPAELIERTWQTVAGQSAEGMKKLVDLMKKEQPVVLLYLAIVDGDILDRSEREVLLHLGIVVWQIMRQGIHPLPKVGPVMLDEAVARNSKMAEYFRGKDRSVCEQAGRSMLNGYRQAEVLRYVIESVMRDAKEGSPVRETNKGTVFLDLKTIIDCWDA